MGTPTDQLPFDPGLTQSYAGTLRRVVNKDGTFNVRRRGTGLHNFHFYKFLIGLSWPWFIAIGLGTFVIVNVAFAWLYLAAGIQTLQGAEGVTRLGTFLNALFFSVQTLTTVGYGSMVPRAIGSNVIASVEALMGVMGFAFGAALIYGRFSRPTARILFSARALIAPYRGKTSLQIRVANQRSNAIVDLEATIVLMAVEGSGEAHRRTYAKLELERPRVFFLPLTWTIVHPLDEASPLYGKPPVSFPCAGDLRGRAVFGEVRQAIDVLYCAEDRVMGHRLIGSALPNARAHENRGDRRVSGGLRAGSLVECDNQEAVVGHRPARVAVDVRAQPGISRGHRPVVHIVAKVRHDEGDCGQAIEGRGRKVEHSTVDPIGHVRETRPGAMLAYVRS
jgi:inward rectifier potassium channel